MATLGCLQYNLGRLGYRLVVIKYLWYCTIDHSPSDSKNIYTIVTRLLGITMSCVMIQPGLFSFSFIGISLLILIALKLLDFRTLAATHDAEKVSL